MQIRTSGGSRESEQKALTVSPFGSPVSDSVVTTVTLLAKRLIALRNSSLSIGIIPPLRHWKPPAIVQIAPIVCQARAQVASLRHAGSWAGSEHNRLKFWITSLQRRSTPR